MKELLDLLEERVTALLRETQALKQENENLRRELTEKTVPLAEENRSLHDALAQEQAVKEAAAKRIDALLLRITERLPE